MNKILPFHIHSDASVFDGVSKIEEYAKKISSNPDKYLQAMMISEHGTLSSQLEAYKTCKKYDLRYIPANEIYFQETFDENAKFYHLLLFGVNEESYREMIKINNLACKEGRFIKRKTINTLSDLKLLEHTFCSTACIGGYTNVELDEKRLLQLYNIFNDKLIIELQTFNDGKQLEANLFNQRMMHKHNLNCILASDAHCVEEKDTPLINVARAMGFKMPLKVLHKQWGKENHNTYLKCYDDFARENEDYQLGIKEENFNKSLQFGLSVFYMTEDFELFRKQEF